MAKVKVTVTSNTIQAYNSAMLGAKFLKCSEGVFPGQKMALRAKVMVKVTMTCITASVSNARYNMIQVSNIGPSWPSCFFFMRYIFSLFQRA